MCRRSVFPNLRTFWMRLQICHQSAKWSLMMPKLSPKRLQMRNSLWITYWPKKTSNNRTVCNSSINCCRWMTLLLELKTWMSVSSSKSTHVVHTVVVTKRQSYKSDLLIFFEYSPEVFAKIFTFTFNIFYFQNGAHDINLGHYHRLINLSSVSKG